MNSDDVFNGVDLCQLLKNERALRELQSVRPLIKLSERYDNDHCLVKQFPTACTKSGAYFMVFRVLTAFLIFLLSGFPAQLAELIVKSVCLSVC